MYAWRPTGSRGTPLRSRWGGELGIGSLAGGDRVDALDREPSAKLCHGFVHRDDPETRRIVLADRMEVDLVLGNDRAAELSGRLLDFPRHDPDPVDLMSPVLTRLGDQIDLARGGGQQDLLRPGGPVGRRQEGVAAQSGVQRDRNDEPSTTAISAASNRSH